MVISVVDKHPFFYHYTNACGLHGIVMTQQIWATNIAFLNDAEEHIGFLDRRLPRLMREAVTKACEIFAAQPDGRQTILEMGGMEKIVTDQAAILAAKIKESTLQFNEPYVASFTGVPPKGHEDDGILSQWQGYGTDGGYAIVFESEPLEQLLIEETSRYQLQLGVWGDVEYYSQLADHKPAYPETIERENAIRDAIEKSIISAEPDSYEALFEPISVLSCTHKHQGFHQEAEVRIVVILTKDKMLRANKELNDGRKKKCIHFRPRDGVLVPYIKLFERDESEVRVKLPIRKIIVGPHQEKHKRKEAVELLLDRHNIDAAVVMSDIPFIGR